MTPVRSLTDLRIDNARPLGHGFVFAVDEVVIDCVAASRSCKNVSAPDAEHLLDIRRDGLAFAPHPLDRLADADRVPASKTPISQPNPHLIALSISTIVSAISGIRFAA